MRSELAKSIAALVAAFALIASLFMGSSMATKSMAMPGPGVLMQADDMDCPACEKTAEMSPASCASSLCAGVAVLQIMTDDVPRAKPIHQGDFAIMPASLMTPPPTRPA
jgi:hypothetical protein